MPALSSRMVTRPSGSRSATFWCCMSPALAWGDESARRSPPACTTAILPMPRNHSCGLIPLSSRRSINRPSSIFPSRILGSVSALERFTASTSSSIVTSPSPLSSTSCATSHACSALISVLLSLPPPPRLELRDLGTGEPGVGSRPDSSRPPPPPPPLSLEPPLRRQFFLSSTSFQSHDLGKSGLRSSTARPRFMAKMPGSFNGRRPPEVPGAVPGVLARDLPDAAVPGLEEAVPGFDAGAEPGLGFSGLRAVRVCSEVTITDTPLTFSAMIWAACKWRVSGVVMITSSGRAKLGMPPSAAVLASSWIWLSPRPSDSRACRTISLASLERPGSSTAAACFGRRPYVHRVTDEYEDIDAVD